MSVLHVLHFVLYCLHEGTGFDYIYILFRNADIFQVKDSLARVYGHLYSTSGLDFGRPVSPHIFPWVKLLRFEYQGNDGQQQNIRATILMIDLLS